MYKFIESSLQREAKAKFLQYANIVGICTVANFTMVMETMTVRAFPTYTYCYHRQYM